MGSGVRIEGGVGARVENLKNGEIVRSLRFVS